MTVHVSPGPTEVTLAPTDPDTAHDGVDGPVATSPPAVSPGVRRRVLGAMVVAAGVLGGAAGVGALSSGIGDAATADVTAERIVVTGDGLLFPIDPAPMCLVFNNFGGFSRTFGSGGHQGVDIGAEQGQEVFAVEGGVLYRQFTDLGSAAGFGWGLLGESDTKYRYYHLAAFADGLVEGQRVDQGQLIGYVGDTGNATPGGYHLHFEVRPGPDPHDLPVDPVPLLDVPRTCTIYPKQG